MNNKILFFVAVSGLLLIAGFGCATKNNNERISYGNTTGAAIIVTPQPIEKKITLQLFFSNTEKKPSRLDCSNVYAATRSFSFTKAVARASLEALLAGPTEDEKSKGYVTLIPDGVLIQSLRIDDSIAYVDFNEKLENGVAGSCRVSTIIAQISETLKQFDTVDEVVISINGRTEDILQP